MRDRRFGVELEFNSNGLGQSGVTRVLREAFDDHGYQRWNFYNRMHHDGSDLELATPILRGKVGFQKLKLVMDTLSYAGCDSSPYDDGLHIHHDAPEFTHNINNCIKIVKSWQANKHLIYEFVDPDRTGSDNYGHWACPPWSKNAIAEMETTRSIPHWDRNDLNLSSLSEHGSIEFRLHEGTLDFVEAESWIKFGQRFIDRVLVHSIRDSKDSTNLLKKVRVSPAAQKVLINKASRMKRNY